MSDVFLSYSREDQAIAQALALGLEERSLSVWWDKKIPAGMRWDEEIETELLGAKHVIVLWSRTSVKSRWVKIEAHAAMDRDILIPLLLEETTMPIGFNLIQTIDFRQWNKSTSHSASDQLWRALNEERSKHQKTCEQ